MKKYSKHVKRSRRVPVSAVMVWVLCAMMVFALVGCTGVGSDADKVYVESVGTITGIENGTGLQNRYAGIVEAQQSEAIELDKNKVFLLCYVEVGQEVQVGTELFSYDVEALQIAYEQAKLEVEGIKNNILPMQDQLKALEAEKKKAPSSAQLDYTLQIQTLQLQIMQAEYSQKTKTLEVEKALSATQNSVVTSPIEGVVQQINLNNETDPYTGQFLPFITIMGNGNLQVKGLINEQNIYLMAPGMQVTLRSRVDSSITWGGTVDRVDMENPQNPNDGRGGMVYYDMAGGSETTQSSKYPFFITLDSSDDLMLGQHVYIEPFIPEKDTGVWLPEVYIMQEEQAAYVWAATSRDRIEKRKITLGEYDEQMGCFLITEGLSIEDEIAFPAETIVEGAAVTRNIEDITPPEFNPEGEFNSEGEFNPEGEFVPEEGMRGEGDFNEDDLMKGDFAEGDFSEDKEGQMPSVEVKPGTVVRDMPIAKGE